MQLIYIFIIVVVLITAIKMIKDGKNLKNALFRKNSPPAKVDILIGQLKKYNGYHKIIVKNNVLVFITEYFIFIGLIIDEVGMLTGNESSDYFVLKYGNSEKSVMNELPYFDSVITKINNEIDGVTLNPYVILGSACMLTFNISKYKMLRVSDVYYNFIRKDNAKNFNESDINKIAKIIEKSLM